MNPVLETFCRPLYSRVRGSVELILELHSESFGWLELDMLYENLYIYNGRHLFGFLCYVSGFCVCAECHNLRWSMQPMLRV